MEEKEEDHDTDLEDEGLSSFQALTYEQLYLEACRQVDVVPVSYFLRHMRDTTMDLSHHGLGAKGTRAICIALVSNAFITSLNLDDNWILAEGVADLAEMLKENCFIQELNLSGNHLEEAGARIVSKLLKKNVSLNSLQLSGNNFKENSCKALAAAMTVNYSIEELDLSHNDFCERGGEHIGHMLAANSVLQVLDLSWNHIRMKGAVTLSAGLKLNSSLKVLNLSHNGFSNDGALALREVLKFNSCLTHLDISSNRIGSEGAGALSKGLEANRTLQVLKLFQNPLNMEAATMLLTSIRKNHGSKMKELDIKNVLVNEQFLSLLDATCKERPNLQVIYGAVTGLIAKKMEQKTDTMKTIQIYLDEKKLRLWDFFRNMDNDGTMLIPVGQFRRALKNQTNIPLNKAQIEELVWKLDKDGTGAVDYRSLVDARKQMLRVERQRIKQEKSQKKMRKQRNERVLRTFKSAMTPQGSILMSPAPKLPEIGGSPHFSATPLSSWYQSMESNSTLHSASSFGTKGAQHLPSGSEQTHSQKCMETPSQKI
uniref:Leucine-rich repeat-containing protein 74A n=1 Tax=Geotrypetes seraphini TaxID=260995 RepID=A0A6P8RU94_GEOSA|nr:leucine-rich repeat-containing protein 74A [Geotrypetes seraphini]